MQDTVTLQVFLEDGTEVEIRRATTWDITTDGHLTVTHYVEEDQIGAAFFARGHWVAAVPESNEPGDRL